MIMMANLFMLATSAVLDVLKKQSGATLADIREHVFSIKNENSGVDSIGDINSEDVQEAVKWLMDEGLIDYDGRFFRATDLIEKNGDGRPRDGFAKLVAEGIKQFITTECGQPQPSDVSMRLDVRLHDDVFEMHLDDEHGCAVARRSFRVPLGTPGETA